MTNYDDGARLMYCPQCEISRRVTELNAFGGMDVLRSTLSCGHIVSRVPEIKS